MTLISAEDLSTDFNDSFWNGANGLKKNLGKNLEPNIVGSSDISFTKLIIEVGPSIISLARFRVGQPAGQFLNDLSGHSVLFDPGTSPLLDRDIHRFRFTPTRVGTTQSRRTGI
mgnify:CR=1 FL=1